MTVDPEDITPERFPGPLYELAIAGQLKAAMDLVAAWGGCTHDIPHPEGLGPASALVRIVGMEAALLIARRYGPGRLYVPLAIGLGAKMRDILSHPGGTAAAARDLRTSEQWVRRVRNQRAVADPAAPEGQLPLFAPPGRR